MSDAVELSDAEWQVMNLVWDRHRGAGRAVLLVSGHRSHDVASVGEEGGAAIHTRRESLLVSSGGSSSRLCPSGGSVVSRSRV
jgi:hypothetical protein